MGEAEPTRDPSANPVNQDPPTKDLPPDIDQGADDVGIDELGIDWALVEDLFVAASELPPDGRAQFLDLRCAGSPDLRRQVESLLESDAQAGQFLIETSEAPAASILDDQAPLTGSTADSVRPLGRIGRYSLLQVIGEGGFGTVYLAQQDRPIQRRVAVKVIKPGMDTRMVIARFELERQALAVMDHPGIAKVFDAGETDSGRPYFVMELVEGISITKYCDQNKLTTEARLELFVAVCNALQHAHQKGIIHRDIKPSNILVSLHEGKPAPKLIDFGIAKAIEDRHGDRTLVTQVRQFIGTPVYMSPEQAEMGARQVDTRSDIYSLGALLYEILTGTPPFDPHDLQLAAQGEMQRIIREVDPPRPSTRLLSIGETLGTVAANRGADPHKLSLQLRAELDWIVLKAMEKDRDRRYESAGELARDVGRYLKNEPVEACPPDSLYRLRKLVRRNRKMFSIAVAAVVFALAAGSAYILSIRGEQRKTEAALREEKNQRADADRSRDQANQSLVIAAVAQAHDSQASLASGRRFSSLQALAAAAKINPSVAVRSQAIGCLALVDMQIIRQWPATNDTICCNNDCTLYAEGVPAAFKPRWALANVDKELLIRRVPLSDAQDPAVVLRLNCPVLRQRVTFSPDGQLLAACGDDGHVRIYSLSGKLVLDVNNGPCFDFTPDSAGFAAARMHGPVDIYDLGTGKAIRELKWDAHGAISFSPDGRRLAMFSTNDAVPSVEVGDLITGQFGRLPQPNTNCALAWHPDGLRLAAAGADGIIYQWNMTDVTEPRPLPTLIGHQRNVFSIEFSHGGDVLASCAWDHTTRLWDPLSGEQLVSVFAGGRLTFSADDRLLGMSGYAGRHLLAQVATGRDARRTLVAPPRNLMRPVAFSPDGLVMASGGSNVIRFWNLSDLAFPSVDLPVTGQVSFVLFTRDGSGLIASTNSGLLRIHIADQPTALDRKGKLALQRRIDPASERLLPLPVHDVSQLQLSPDGGAVAMAQWGQEPRLVNLHDPSQVVRLAGASTSTAYISWSPDGKWIATGTWRTESGPCATVWDAKTGRRVVDLPVFLDSTVAFSPDNRWLVTCTMDEYRFWRVGSWKPDHAIPRKADAEAFIIFSPDSRTVAISTAALGLKLVEADTGNEIATFDDRGEGLPAGFSPDGTRLITTCQNAPAGPTLRLWELPEIRRKLKEMNLDWSAPELIDPPPSVRMELSLESGVDRQH